MRRNLTMALTSLLLAVGMVFALCACSSYNSILSAFKKAGYTEAEISDTYKNEAKKWFGDDYADVLTIHVLKKEADESDGILGAINKATTFAVIAEFNSTKEMNEHMEEAIRNLEEQGYSPEQISEEIQKLPNVNGNCVLFVYTRPEGLEIFQSTKK